VEGHCSGKEPLESGIKVVTYHSWFACPHLDLQG